MAKSASTVFEFLERNEDVSIDRHEIASTAFSSLRRFLRGIIFALSDSDAEDATDISCRLRTLLSEWLTVPVPFDQSIGHAIFSLFGEPERVGRQWGNDILHLYNSALNCAKDLTLAENPVREKLKAIINEACDQGLLVRIHCHRMARPHFEPLFELEGDLSIDDDIFLHNLRDYRRIEPFDVLIKVGALRARGWGSVPDAILTAPVFKKLVQIVWSGCKDEDDFGYDPCVSDIGISEEPEVPSLGRSVHLLSSVKLNRQIFRSGEDLSCFTGEEADQDELYLFRQIAKRELRRTATFLQVTEAHGIFYRPNSRVLSFDPDKTAQRPIDSRIPGDTLIEGLFLIFPLGIEMEAETAKAEHGYYSRIWKSKLPPVSE
ncbi:MAG: hypothetical protein K9N21_09600 [Deltaproteobacteria bacterium]|nr:hypothetical protein [Deltaproteobacteria bacterium]